MILNKENAHTLEVIEKAIKEKRNVVFDYVDLKFQITTRRVEPAKVINQTLIGKDLGRTTLGSFTLTASSK